MSQLLRHEREVIDFLRDRGIVTATERVLVKALGGGVSNLVFAASAESGRYVVKQSLARLRVADEWLAPRERTLTEAAAMRLAHEITPHAVPQLVDCDETRYALVMRLAPTDWTDWKSRLLSGRAEEWAARELGSTLARWHSATAGARGVPAQFADPAAFVALRVDPYHREVMRRRPELAEPVGHLVEQMLERRRCLVHGDFSPKNVLVGRDALWVTDFEVSHLGDPAFDVGFLITHLLLKSVHRPAATDRYHACAIAFLEAYQECLDPGLAFPPGYLSRHIGCLLAARVDGKSVAEYLTEGERALVRNIAAAMLRRPVDHPDEIWEQLTWAVRS
ncbi:phosphotransferase [Micromonospora sp. LZ34]